MDINPLSPSNVSNTIWAATTRSLTNFGSGALVIASTSNGSLAASATLTFAAVANAVQVVYVYGHTGAAGGGTWEHFDGTNIVQIGSAIGTNTIFNVSGQIANATNQLKLINGDATNALVYSNDSYRLQQ